MAPGEIPSETAAVSIRAKVERQPPYECLYRPGGIWNVGQQSSDGYRSVGDSDIAHKKFIQKT
jgi:hypothetical protein